MTGEYQFLRTKGGKSYFARAWVEVQANGSGATCEDALPSQVNPDEGEVNSRTAPAWISAALEGISLTLDHARLAGLLSNGCKVRLVKLVGTVVDTTEDVVRCAAGLATWKGLGYPGPDPETEFDGRHWHLLFPAGVGQPHK